MYFYVITFILIFLSNSSSASPLGGGSTGGSHTCEVDGQPILLDFVVNHRQIPESKRLPGVQFTVTELMKKIGIDELSISETLLASELSNILSKIKGGPSSRVYQLLRNAIDGFNIYGTDLPINQVATAYFGDQTLCTSENTWTTIYYHETFMVINIPSINEDDRLSQVGRFVHEMLRQIQIRYKGNGSEKDLQELTTQLVFAREGIDLESHPFFSNILQPQVEIKRQQLQSHFKICKDAGFRFQKMSVKAFEQEVRDLDSSLRLSCEQTGNFEVPLKLSRNLTLKLIGYRRQVVDSKSKRRSWQLLLSETASLRSTIETMQLGSILGHFEQNRPSVINAIEGLNNVPLRALINMARASLLGNNIDLNGGWNDGGYGRNQNQLMDPYSFRKRFEELFNK